MLQYKGDTATRLDDAARCLLAFAAKETRTGEIKHKVKKSAVALKQPAHQPAQSDHSSRTESRLRQHHAVVERECKRRSTTLKHRQRHGKSCVYNTNSEIALPYVSRSWSSIMTSQRPHPPLSKSASDTTTARTRVFHQFAIQKNTNNSPAQ